jgi:hypothetical protein
VIVLDADAETPVARIGSGERGLVDGSAQECHFAEPNGLCRLPDDVAAEVGYDVVVADTANHALRGVRLDDGGRAEVRTVSGGGATVLSSPWDVCWWQDRVWVAMAGVHQLWTFDPRTGVTEVVAGTGNEGLLDGPLRDAWFAQTSGLAAAGNRLWLVDSETSSLRYVQEESVHTVVGSGLFDFGFRDGERGTALLQHPLGVSVLPDGSVAVCDTYNGAVRRWADGALTTVATGLAEPSGAVVCADHLLVVESAAHRLTRVPLVGVVPVDGFVHTTQRPVTEVAGGPLELVVGFDPPPGQKVDDRFGPAAQLVVTATPPALLREGAGRGTDLARTLVVDPAVGDGVLHVAARAASCDEDGGQSAACYLHQQDWGIPVRVSAGGMTRIDLPLLVSRLPE